METIARKKFEGIKNILLFNNRMYGFAVGIIAILFVIKTYLPENEKVYCDAFIVLILTPTSLSLIVSFYIYDCSDLYKMNWLNKLNIPQNSIIANISAGFDETSQFINYKLKPKEILMYDFYDATKHTEYSIKIAREFYPPSKDLISISTTNIFLQDSYIDYIFLILSAHEIRDEEERILFFAELKRIIKSNGKIIFVEHQRNVKNFIAYNIGFMHFHSNKAWLKTFHSSTLQIETTFNITPFIKTYILTKNGNSF